MFVILSFHLSLPGPLRPEIYPLRSEICPFRPEICSFRPEIYPLRPEICPLRPEICPLRPETSPLISKRSALGDVHIFFTQDISELEKKRLLDLKVTNKKRLGTLGWECPSQIKIFVGHKCKLYAILLENNSEIIKVKGVTQKHLSLRFDHFYCFLLGPKYEMLCSQSSIRSKNLQLSHETFTKKLTDKLELKRYWLSGNIHSLGYGNRLIPLIEECWELLDRLVDTVCRNIGETS